MKKNFGITNKRENIQINKIRNKREDITTDCTAIKKNNKRLWIIIHQ